MDDFITLARTLIGVGWALLLVMLRLDAERFGTAEYYEATRDGEKPRIRRPLAWDAMGAAPGGLLRSAAARRRTRGTAAAPRPAPRVRAGRRPGDPHRVRRAGAADGLVPRLGRPHRGHRRRVR